MPITATRLGTGGARRLEIEVAPDGSTEAPGPWRMVGGASLLAHFADVAASNDRVVVEMSNGRAIAGQIGFPLLDRRLVPFWVPNNGALPDLPAGPVRLQYRCANAVLSLETTAESRWDHALWMIQLPDRVEVPGVRLAARHQLHGWQVLLRRGRSRAAVPVLDLSTVGVQFRTPTEALAPAVGAGFEASLLSGDGMTEIPVRGQVARRKVDLRGRVSVGCDFRGIGFNAIVRIAAVIRVAENRKRRKAA